MIIRKVDIANVKSDIDQLGKDIAFGKIEIERQISSINHNLTTIDDLQGEIYDCKVECDESKEMIKHCRESISEDENTLTSLQKKLSNMLSDETQYIKPSDKTRPNTELSIGDFT